MGNEQIQIGFSNLTINTCFQNHYTVPDYQREYVWTSTQVEQLLSDLLDGFHEDYKKDYFLGTIVTYKNGNLYELIDGQQRLTTFYIILCALRKMYIEHNEQSTVIENLIYSPVMNEFGDTVPSYHLQLQYEEASNYLELIYNDAPKPSFITNSGERLFAAFTTIQYFFADKLSDFIELKKFAAYFLNKARFIQIETYDITDALKIFETINQRGVGLNPMDLLKNMIFRQVERSKFKELNLKWKEITDSLENIKEKPLRFLRYFIMSNYDVDDIKGNKLKDGVLREDQIYDWLNENNHQCQYEEKPFEFVQRMKSCVDQYISYLKPIDLDNSNIHLKNIPLLAGTSYKLHILLLLSAYNMEPVALNKFKGIVESIVYYTVINRIAPNYTERVFTAWCRKIRNIRTIDDLNIFVDSTVIPVINEWKKDNEQLFMRLGLKSMQQYRLKFIMAKIFAYIDALRIGKTEIGILSNYLDTGVEIEHIMPKTCYDKSTYGLTDDEFGIYLNRMGNLTLLENSINKSIHNDIYSNKCEAYQQSKFYLTKSIPALIDQGENTAINRANKKLRDWNTWDKNSIEDRQRMLYELSEEIWSIKAETVS